jgi:hypothetical protein
MMQPSISPDRSTLIALAGLAVFFVVIVLAWIIAFRRYGARMVSTTSPDEPTEDEAVRIVEVPIAGAVDGGPLLGGRTVETTMRVADRDTGQRRTVRKLIAPTAPPASPVPNIPDAPDFPDETPPPDCSQQQTQALPVVSNVAKPVKLKYPVIYNYAGEPWIVEIAMPPEQLPRDCWN